MDGASPQTVIELICEASAHGAAIVGIFHEAHAAVVTRHLNVAAFRNLHQSVMHVIETKKITLSEPIKNSPP